MKKLITFLIAFLMVIGIALAQPVAPSPVKILVKVNDHNVDYDFTIVTNLGTGEVLTVQDVGSLRIERGVGFFDLLDFDLGYDPKSRRYPGDTIEIKACDIHAECTTSFQIDSTVPRKVYLTLYDDSIPTEVIVKEFQCYDGTFEFTAAECPVPPEPTTETKTIIEKEYFCADGTSVAKASDCVPPEEEDDTLQDWLIGLIAGIIGVFAWGKGFAALIKWRLKKAKEADAAGDKELARKYRATAEKMAKTTVFNFLAGKYKKNKK